MYSISCRTTSSARRSHAADWKLLFGLLVATLGWVSAAEAGTSANRPYPFPNYRVGQTAVLQITTSPVQANQPVYRFRYKNGLPDGSQPTFIGNTDATGKLTNSYTLQATDVGTYSGERFAVGSQSASTTSSISYEVHAASPPTAVRPSANPNYSVGDTARVEVSTQPAQPHQKVYRFRYKDGQADGSQPTLLGWTNSSGYFMAQGTLTTNEVGHYTGEQYSVGTINGPRSTARSYYVKAGAAPTVVRDAPYPSYTVGDSATIRITTNPAQRHQKVYRSHRKDGAWISNVVVGWTDGNGALTIQQPLSDADIGTYTYESYSVGTTLGPKSANLSYTIAAPLPRITSIAPQRVSQGTVTDIVVEGEHLAGASVRVEGDTTPPSVSVVGGSSDGTTLDVLVDTTDPGIYGYFTLVVDNGAGTDRVAFEVAPLGPTVDAYTPSTPEQGSTYALVILGHNLSNVTVTSTNPQHVRVRMPQSSPYLTTAFDQPVHGDLAADRSLQGLLEISDGAPLGPAQILITDAEGGVTTLDLNVKAAGGAAVAGVSQISLKDIAVAKAGSSASSLPELSVQDFHVEQALSLGKIGELEPVGDCELKARFSAGKQVAWMESFGDAGRILTTASLLLGQPRNFEVVTFAAYVHAEARLYWNCDPDVNDTEIYWHIRLGFDIVGLFSAEFIIRSDTGRVLFAGEVDSVFDDFSFNNPPNNCLQTTPLIEGTGHNFVASEQTSCCPSEIPVSLNAEVHPRSSVFSAQITAFEHAVIKTQPDETECPCWVSSDWFEDFPDQSLCPPSELFLEEVSFLDGHTIFKDTTQLAADGFIENPVWTDRNLDLSPEKNEPVAFSAGDLMRIEAKLRVDPPVLGPLEQQIVKIRGTGPEGFIFEKDGVELSGSSVTVELMANKAFLFETRHFDKFTINWEYSTDGLTFFSAGQSQHELFVTLEDPLPSLGTLYLSALHLALGSEGATTYLDAALFTWHQFALPGSGGPLNITTWEGTPLVYYPQGVGFGACAADSLGLLRGLGAGWAGQCGAFAHLLKEALAINGIDSYMVTVSSTDYVSVGSSGGSEGHGFLIGDFVPLNDRGGAYPWKIQLQSELSGGGQGLWGMVPAFDEHIFGDLQSVWGKPGQNSLMPSEKAFEKHFILEVPTLGLYLDPSYGFTYSGPGEFESKAVYGFFREIPGQPGFFEARPASLNTPPIAFHRSF